MAGGYIISKCKGFKGIILRIFFYSKGFLQVSLRIFLEKGFLMGFTMDISY